MDIEGAFLQGKKALSTTPQNPKVTSSYLLFMDPDEDLLQSQDKSFDIF